MSVEPGAGRGEPERADELEWEGGDDDAEMDGSAERRWRKDQTAPEPRATPRRRLPREREDMEKRAEARKRAEALKPET